MTAVPYRRASRADTWLADKIQAYAPLPEREFSTATGAAAAVVLPPRVETDRVLACPVGVDGSVRNRVDASSCVAPSTAVGTLLHRYSHSIVAGGFPEMS